MKKINLPTFKTEQEDSDYYFSFENELWIRGIFINGILSIRDMYYGNQEENHQNSKKGFGTLALLSLKEKYGTLEVDEVTEDALPFWTKMVERGIVKSIESFWDN